MVPSQSQLTLLLLASVTSAWVSGCARRPSADGGMDARLAGRWDGALRLSRAEQRVVLDVREVGDAVLAVMHVPDQLRTDSTVAVRRARDTIEVTLSGGPEQVTLRGMRRGDTLALAAASGAAGAAARVQLRLVRGGPIPPPTYRTEDVVVSSAAGPLRGTLVRPAGAGPHPAVVLIHGSGAHTRHALLPLARHFAEHGVAALAHDKRPITRVGNEELTRGVDLAADALAGVRLLRARRDVRGDRVGLWGGSQGSGVAALAAADAATRGEDVAFVVSVSGGGTPFTPFIQYQTAHRLRRRGLSEALIADALEIIRLRHAYLRTGADSAALAARLARARPALAATGMSLHVPTSAERAAWAAAAYLDGDAAAPWKRVAVPVLALWGARDEVVPPAPSAAGVRGALREARNPDATVCVAADADHGMMLPGGPGAAPDGGFAFPRLATAYREGMIAWVRERVGLPVPEPAAATLARAGCG